MGGLARSLASEERAERAVESEQAPPDDGPEQELAIQDYERRVATVASAAPEVRSRSEAVRSAVQSVIVAAAADVVLTRVRCGAALCTTTFEHESVDEHMKLIEKLTNAGGESMPGLEGPLMMRRHASEDGRCTTTIYSANRDELPEQRVS